MIEIFHAVEVDRNLNSVIVENAIVCVDLSFKRGEIRKSGTSARLDLEAKKGGRIGLAGTEAGDFCDRRRAEFDHAVAKKRSAYRTAIKFPKNIRKQR